MVEFELIAGDGRAQDEFAIGYDDVARRDGWQSGECSLIRIETRNRCVVDEREDRC